MSYLRKFIGLSLLLAGFCFVSLFFLSSPPTSADEPSSTAHATATITVPEACTFSGTVNTPHRAEVPAGTYVADIGSTIFKVVCNDSGGFSVYAIGYTGKREKNDNNNVLDATIGGTLTPAYNIASGTATSGNTSNWAMKLTPVTGTYAPTITNSYDDYNTVPLTSTKVAQFTSVTDAGNNATGSSFTATYRAYVSGGQPAGTYDGKVKYIMVHPATNVPNEPKDCPANNLCYFPNAGNTVADSMGDQSISSTTSATLWASNFKRPGYGFAGWSDAYDYVVNEGSESNPDAHIYGPNETIEFTAGTYSSTNGGLRLYAVWVPSAGSLQGWSGCSTLGEGKITALTDERDNDTYAVTKLADGKCWMIENLRLDTAGSLDATKSSTGSYGGVFSGLANPETAAFTNSTTVNSRYKSDGSGDIYNGATNPTTLNDIGTNNYPGYRMPRYNNSNTNDDSAINPNTTVINMDGVNQNIYSYGNYYTWASAIVDTAYYGTGNVSVATSLCPTGWRLPRGGNKSNEANNDFWNLVVNELNGGTKPANYESQVRPYYTGTAEAGPVDKKIRKYPNNFIYSGNITGGGSANSRGSYGEYWSSTAYDRYYAYKLVFYNSGVYSGTYNNAKYGGLALRCVFGS
ncbi:hypothetical protein IIY24_01335 [Candidatus Saccharibacteria bacterium]|nr:hypothetical protein [Candidatus Saccharibacteria bacterium]